MMITILSDFPFFSYLFFFLLQIRVEQKKWSSIPLSRVSKRETTVLSTALTQTVPPLTFFGTNKNLEKVCSCLYIFFQMRIRNKDKDSLFYWIRRTNISPWTSQLRTLTTQPPISVLQEHSGAQAPAACTQTWVWVKAPILFFFATEIVRYFAVLLHFKYIDILYIPQRRWVSKWPKKC